jgi:hypothetical protein
MQLLKRGYTLASRMYFISKKMKAKNLKASKIGVKPS